MRHSVPDLAALDALPFDEVIDVRAPAEFAEDHLPGAINLPVLSDAERARVGTIYVRQDRFLARKVGAALVSRNAAAHLEGPLADRDGGWRPLVYCWRGGQRSGSFASILEQIGWRVGVLEGGYKAYRRLVKTVLYDADLPVTPILIDGGTGTGKTQLLPHMQAAGAQVIDLEGLANHRGSNFGGRAGGQPAQKMFESRLAAALSQLDPDRPLFLEAESNAIGDVLIPPSLWKAMRAAPVVRLDAPAGARARHLLSAYPDLSEDGELLHRRIDALRPYHPGDTIAAWHDLARTGALVPLAEALIEHHYDPRYRTAARDGTVIGHVTLTDLSETDLGRAAAEIVAL
ncbi:tRNA 2-selenouridine(34) synthase MnmH, partial [Jannaschia seosinensis]|uniref:tRNA 2-selenouridine(34) synthase MnmH n=1 Tax=Jannaschia seosinensis TaxID=313367 RepID=UPI0006E269D3